MLAPLTAVAAGLSGALLLQAAAAAQSAAINRRKAFTTGCSSLTWGIGHDTSPLEYLNEKYAKCQLLRNNSQLIAAELLLRSELPMKVKHGPGRPMKYGRASRVGTLT